MTVPVGAYIIKRTGLPGSGKSYSVMMFIIEFLLEESGVHYSNFPVSVDAFCEHFDSLADSNPDVPTEEEIRRRIQVIPSDVEKSWRAGESGPWEYFAEMDLVDCWISLDEAHTFAGKNHKVQHRTNWVDFNGEMRHRGCRIEYVTQDPDQLAGEVDLACSYWIEVRNGEMERSPNLGVPQADLFQLQAKKQGFYQSFIREVHFRKSGRRYREEPAAARRFWLKAANYALYNSYSAPKNGGTAGRQTQPWERYSRRQLYFWFWKRNAFNLFFNRYTVSVLLLGVGVSVFVVSQSRAGGVKTWDDVHRERMDEADEIEVSQIGVRVLPSVVDESEEEGSLVVPEVVAILDGVAVTSSGAEFVVGSRIGDVVCTLIAADRVVFNDVVDVWVSYSARGGAETETSGVRDRVRSGGSGSQRSERVSESTSVGSPGDRRRDSAVVR